MRLIFFLKYSKFNAHFRNARKNPEKVLLSRMLVIVEISAFELVAVNSPDSKQNACNLQSKC